MNGDGTASQKAIKLLGVIVVLVAAGLCLNVYASLKASSAARSSEKAATSGRQISADNNRMLDNMQAIADYLLECTTPTPAAGPRHECFETGNQRTAAVVGDIRRSIDCQGLFILSVLGFKAYEPGPDCVDVVARTEGFRARP